MKYSKIDHVNKPVSKIVFGTATPKMFAAFRSVYGDALSTICFSLGLEDGMKFIESMDGYEAIFVDAQNELHYSMQ